MDASALGCLFSSHFIKNLVKIDDHGWPCPLYTHGIILLFCLDNYDQPTKTSLKFEHQELAQKLIITQ